MNEASPDRLIRRSIVKMALLLVRGASAPDSLQGSITFMWNSRGRGPGDAWSGCGNFFVGRPGEVGFRRCLHS